MARDVRRADLARPGVSLFDLPVIAAEEILGVDYHTDAERLPLGALVHADGVRVDIDGNLRSWGGLEEVLDLAGEYALAIGHYEGNDELTLVTVDGMDLDVWDVPRDFGSMTSRGTFSVVSSDVDVACLVSMYEKMFIQVWKERLHYLDDTTVTLVASADTDLDQDSDSSDPLNFTSIVEFGGHLIGFGFGDQTGSGTMETGDLGADRPELARWSEIGNPLSWRPEDWQIIGTRGHHVLQGVVAFGRCVCLKPEGVFLLYGDLENGFSQVEELHVERGLSSGGVSPHGATYYDGALYWASHAGAMRWQGGRAAEYIGKAIDPDFTPLFRNYSTEVIPVPQLDAILFAGYNDPDPPDGFPGGPTVTPGQTLMRGWLWDTLRERWIGKVLFGGSAQRVFAVVPDENGERRTVTALPAHEQVVRVIPQAASDHPAGADGWSIQSGIVQLDAGKMACVRGLLIEGDWEAMSGEFDLRVMVDDVSAKLRQLFVNSSTPTATQAGDLWYDTANGYVLEWDGSSWKRQPGAPEGVVRMSMDTIGRTAQVRIAVSNQTGGVSSVIRRMALQVTPE